MRHTGLGGRGGGRKPFPELSWPSSWWQLHRLHCSDPAMHTSHKWAFRVDRAPQCSCRARSSPLDKYGKGMGWQDVPLSPFKYIIYPFIYSFIKQTNKKKKLSRLTPPAFEWQVLHWLDSAPFVVVVFIASNQIIVSNSPMYASNITLAWCPSVISESPNTWKGLISVQTRHPKG